MSYSKPLLSICIPTYNRAHLLESALFALAPQIRMFENIVELIVSDNCSTDNTEQVVKKIQELIPIRYYRNAQNEGCGRNILRLTDELAEGEFAWVLGDDDLVRPDGVKRVLSVLEKNPEIDFVLVQTVWKSPNDRIALNRSISGLDLPDLMQTKDEFMSDRYMERWEELIDPDIDNNFMTAIMYLVFRLSRWKMHKLELEICDEPFTSLEDTYPHAVILAHTMIGRKTYYIGDPYVIGFYGYQEWLGYMPMLVLVRVQELLDLYLRLGVDVKQVEKCRQSLLDRSKDALYAMLLDHNTLGRQYFSLRVFLWKNIHHSGQVVNMLISILLRWICLKLPKPVYQLLRIMKRNIFKFLNKLG
jgi:glycosyltransferase involved in cell wall biosynthesis